MMLVSLEQARQHLRSDTDADDADLVLKIEAASEAVMSYISDNHSAAFTDSAGQLYEDSQGIAIGVPRRVQSAALLTVAYLYRERDGKSEAGVDAQWGYGYTLPKSATMLLYSMRRPVVGL